MYCKSLPEILLLRNESVGGGKKSTLMPLQQIHSHRLSYQNHSTRTLVKKGRNFRGCRAQNIMEEGFFTKKDFVCTCYSR